MLTWIAYFVKSIVAHSGHTVGGAISIPSNGSLLAHFTCHGARHVPQTSKWPEPASGSVDKAAQTMHGPCGESSGMVPAKPCTCLSRRSRRHHTGMSALPAPFAFNITSSSVADQNLGFGEILFWHHEGELRLYPKFMIQADTASFHELWSRPYNEEYFTMKRNQ